MSDPGTEGEASSIDERWRALAAPIGAAAVLVLGVSLLFFRGTGDAEVAGPIDDDRTTEPRDTPETEVETSTVDSGLPRPTPPPLIEPTTVPIEIPTAPPTTATTSTEVTPATTAAPPPKTTPPATTSPPASSGTPTVAEVQAALIDLDDLDNVNWRSDTIPEVSDPCGSNPEAGRANVDEAVLFSRLQIEGVVVRQIGNQILSFDDAATAERYFDTELANVEACNGDTIDVNGTDYLLSVVSQSFSDEQAAAFPCADDSVLLILQLTNDAADVPYLGDSVGSFRCGRNVMIVSFTSTLDLDDLDDPDFFNAIAASNIAVAELDGS